MIKAMRRNSFLKSVFLSLTLMTCSLQLSGCFALLVGAAVGAGTAVWMGGKLQQDFTTSVDRAHNAAVATLKKLQLPVIVDRKDKMTAKLESEYSDGKHVWVDVEYRTKTVTRVAIRVGTLGDEVRSREILDNISRQL